MDTRSKAMVHRALSSHCFCTSSRKSPCVITFERTTVNLEDASTVWCVDKIAISSSLHRARDSSASSCTWPVSLRSRFRFSASGSHVSISGHASSTIVTLDRVLRSGVFQFAHLAWSSDVQGWCSVEAFPAASAVRIIIRHSRTGG